MCEYSLGHFSIRFSVELQSGIFGENDSRIAKALNKHAAALLPLVSGQVELQPHWQPFPFITTCSGAWFVSRSYVEVGEWVAVYLLIHHGVDSCMW